MAHERKALTTGQERGFPGGQLPRDLVHERQQGRGGCLAHGQREAQVYQGEAGDCARERGVDGRSHLLIAPYGCGRALEEVRAETRGLAEDPKQLTVGSKLYGGRVAEDDHIVGV